MDEQRYITVYGSLVGHPAVQLHLMMHCISSSPLLSCLHMHSHHSMQGSSSIPEAWCQALCVSPPRLTLQGIKYAPIKLEFMYPGRIIQVFRLAVIYKAGQKLLVRARIAISAH